MIELYGPIGASLYDSDSKDAFMTRKLLSSITFLCDYSSGLLPSSSSSLVDGMAKVFFSKCFILIGRILITFVNRQIAIIAVGWMVDSITGGISICWLSGGARQLGAQW